jgi:hypothetical protein
LVFIMNVKHRNDTVMPCKKRGFPVKTGKPLIN